MKRLHALALALTLVATTVAGTAHASFNFQKASETTYVLDLYNPLKTLFAADEAKQLATVVEHGPLNAAFKKYLSEAKGARWQPWLTSSVVTRS